MPDCEVELGGPVPVPDSSSNPGGYAGEHEVEFDSDVDLELDGEVDIVDSLSCRAWGWDRQRIDLAESLRLAHLAAQHDTAESDRTGSDEVR